MVEKEGLKTKICASCNLTKTLKQFYAHKQNKDGFSVRCKQCYRDRKLIRDGTNKVDTRPKYEALKIQGATQKDYKVIHYGNTRFV